jgi:hypothetical protein
MASPEQPRNVIVSYTSPSASQTFTQSLPNTPAEPSTAERTTYLYSLRSSIKQVQSDVNVFLTQKMEEDKVAAGQAAANDEKDEEHYGEEVADETA